MADTATQPDPMMVALVALLVDERQARITDGDVKTELLLNRCGLHHTVIAQLMGKQPDAVRKAISRTGDGNRKAKAGA